MSTEHDAIRGIYEQWHDAWNERDLDRLMALCAEDAVIETPNALA
jgi:ketosteroid isomerase-like protein